MSDFQHSKPEYAAKCPVCRGERAAEEVARRLREAREWRDVEAAQRRIATDPHTVAIKALERLEEQKRAMSSAAIESSRIMLDRVTLDRLLGRP